MGPFLDAVFKRTVSRSGSGYRRVRVRTATDAAPSWMRYLRPARTGSARPNRAENDMTDATRPLNLTGCAELAGMPRWRLRLLRWTGQFIPSDHTDAAGRKYWDPDRVQRWITARPRSRRTPPRQ